MINNQASPDLAKTKMSVQCKQLVNGLTEDFPGQRGDIWAKQIKISFFDQSGASFFFLVYP
jgi:hypothetical protein